MNPKQYFSCFGLMALVLAILGLASLSTAQFPQQGSGPQPGSGSQQPGSPQQPNQQQAGPCTTQFESTVTSECFDASGVNFGGIMYILSGNRSGAIPTGYTYQSFIQFVCSADIRDKVTPCILMVTKRYNTSECAQERDQLMGRSGQLLAFLDAVCGQPCEQESVEKVLIQCYTANNLNPVAVIGPNASIVDDKFLEVARNESAYDNFCRNQEKLFSCLKPLQTSCPSLIKKLYEIGLDLQAMEPVSKTVCANKPKYLSALTCYTTPNQDMSLCDQATIANMEAVMAGRYQTGVIPPSKYMDSLCKVKVTEMTCELSAFAKNCDASSAEFWTSKECGMFPKPCMDNPLYQAEYNAICQKGTNPAPGQSVPLNQGQPAAVPV